MGSGVGKLKSGKNGYRDCYPMSSGDFPVALVLIFVERRIGGNRVGQGERMAGAHGDASGPPLMVSPGMPSLPRSELIGENTSAPRFSNHKVEKKMRPDRHGPAGADYPGGDGFIKTNQKPKTEYCGRKKKFADFGLQKRRK